MIILSRKNFIPSFVILLNGALFILWGIYGFVPETSQTSDFQQLKISAGKHSARPYWFSYQNRESLKLQHIFTESAEYHFEDVDQMDWNKLTGFSFDLFTNHQNAAMVSWRWGVDCQCIELGMYYHVNGKRLIVKNGAGEVWVTAKPNEIITTAVEILKSPDAPNHHQIRITISTPSGTVSHQQLFDINLDQSSRVINPWHGGNRPALHDIFIYRKFTP